MDNQSETMQSKIRNAQNMKVPYMVIVGDNEIKDKTISVRKRNGENRNNLDFEEFLSNLKQEIATYT